MIILAIAIALARAAMATPSCYCLNTSDEFCFMEISVRAALGGSFFSYHRLWPWVGLCITEPVCLRPSCTSHIIGCEVSLPVDVPAVEEIGLSSTCGCGDCGAILGTGDLGNVGCREPVPGEPFPDKMGFVGEPPHQPEKETPRMTLVTKRGTCSADAEVTLQQTVI
ncbi:unnamed protein product [Parnassius apollo]|uniref:(apollo) hypothetical protein n=1 Tax=Parnassius apollo TaxID=110799 RepID=A0A8S3W759_PARAO|nr:unnamed protein product [Parnassius apollo]